MNNIKKTTEQFINNAVKIHGNKYDYSLVNYINNCTNVIIICSVHGEFLQRPINHLHGQGCRGCSSIRQSKLQQYTTNIFIRKSQKTHGNKYDYSLVNYISYINKVKIICKKHGIFEQLPSDHIRGIGCSKCNESKSDLVDEELILRVTNIVKERNKQL